MKHLFKLLLSILLVLFSSQLIGQCSSYIYLESQADVDNFEVDHPDCVSQGWLANITLDGSNIKTVFCVLD